MAKVTPISSRKNDHIRINLEENVHSDRKTGLEKFHFTHQALPELNLDEVNLKLKLFNHDLQAPLLISSMTGGTKQATSINRTLAEAAQVTGVAMGLGSQRAALLHPELVSTFQVRRYAPDILLFSNLGAVQLNYGMTLDDCQRAVEMIAADALILHLNALQEAIQPEGETKFVGLLKKIEHACHQLPVPIIIKEVGWGISEKVARMLVNAGVAAIDVAGAGGTSWSQVEMHRAQTESQARLAATFVDWGIPTADSIIQVHQAVPEIPIFASGGLRNGVDVAKCIALGATLGGLASPLLKVAVQSPEATIQYITDTKRELQVCMFACGSSNFEELQHTQLVRTQD